MRFISVTKPGIIFGNLIAVLGGYFLAAPHPANFIYLTWLLVGVSLVIASGCVFNNIIDRDIDRIMERTKNRVLARGELSIPIATIYALLLGIFGFGILFFKINPLTTYITFIGFFIYAVIYSLFLKRRSLLSTPIGAIAGAIPPVAGFCAVSNNLNLGALIIFAILLLWQIPHFYAIAIYRIEDFKAVSLPVLPLRKNIEYTKKAILFYILLFIPVTLLPTLYGYTGKIYFITALIVGLIWFILGLVKFNTEDNKIWARKIFLFSIINLTLLCVTIMATALVY